jgi:Fasciclin domain
MIRYHVVAGACTAQQLAGAGQLPTFLGASFPLRFMGTRNGLLVTAKYSQAQIVATPVQACSSMVYKIDVVLLPAQALTSVPGNFSALGAAPPGQAVLPLLAGAGKLSHLTPPSLRPFSLSLTPHHVHLVFDRVWEGISLALQEDVCLSLFTFVERGKFS